MKNGIRRVSDPEDGQKTATDATPLTAIYQCALERDLSLFEAGDVTEVCKHST
jgi:hypothetical protein